MPEESPVFALRLMFFFPQSKSLFISWAFETEQADDFLGDVRLHIGTRREDWPGPEIDANDVDWMICEDTH